MRTRVLRVLRIDVPTVVTSTAVARRLRVTRERVHQLAALGRLRVHAVTPAHVHLFDVEDVERLRGERSKNDGAGRKTSAVIDEGEDVKVLGLRASKGVLRCRQHRTGTIPA